MAKTTLPPVNVSLLSRQFTLFERRSSHLPRKENTRVYILRIYPEIAGKNRLGFGLNRRLADQRCVRIFPEKWMKTGANCSRFLQKWETTPVFPFEKRRAEMRRSECLLSLELLPKLTKTPIPVHYVSLNTLPALVVRRPRQPQMLGA